MIRIRYAWTRIFFSKIETNLGFQKYPDTCGRDHCVRQLAFSEFPKLSLSKRG